MTKQEIARHTLITIIDTLYHENRIGASTCSALKEGISELNRPCPTFNELLWKEVEPELEGLDLQAVDPMNRAMLLHTYTIKQTSTGAQVRLKLFLDR